MIKTAIRTSDSVADIRTQILAKSETISEAEAHRSAVDSAHSMADLMQTQRDEHGITYDGDTPIFP